MKNFGKIKDKFERNNSQKFCKPMEKVRKVLSN